MVDDRQLLPWKKRPISMRCYDNLGKLVAHYQLQQTERPGPYSLMPEEES